MNVLLLQLDGKIPNIALMRLAAHHLDAGDSVELRWGKFRRLLWGRFDRVYASAIFEKTRPRVDIVKREFPGAIVGGTGVDLATTLESIGIQTRRQDYSIYSTWRQSIGFTQRGCRLKCEFCVVPRKEGGVREENTIAEIWRGEPWPRELLLLDNDFFGQPNWRDRINEIRDGEFKVSFNQGINARFLSDEAAEAIASIDYRDDSMTVKRIYTAWDNRKDEDRLFAGLNRLVKYGVRPDEIMVYMLIGFWPGETDDDWEYRRRRLREFGCRPYPMPFRRTKQAIGFQRFVVRRADLKVSWQDYKAANYRPERLQHVPTVSTQRELFDGTR
jgi:hypothetical protein